MTCTACGAELADHARFCSRCGTPTGDDPTQATGALTPVDTPAADTAGGSPSQFAVIVVNQGPNKGMAYTLTPPVVKVGRNPDQEVFLDDITVSRQHAELRWVEGGWRLVDLGSLNGSFVNQAAVSDVALASGDEIQIGKYRFWFMSGAGQGR
jgi:pSer/pThr/pTyr-binding forkhead associated (FHA) protein